MSDRSVSWQHPEGSRKTVEIMTNIIGRHKRHFQEFHDDFYPTFEMKKNWDHDKLIARKDMLKDWIDLDPRGGFLIVRHQRSNQFNSFQLKLIQFSQDA